MEYYSGSFPNSPASGALFSVNPKTNDARISGSLASLCGLEKAVTSKDPAAINMAIARIIMMQAHSFLLGGIPMIFYGDEVGYTNDYSYLSDAGKAYDNRWMHRPIIDWRRNERIEEKGSVEERIYSATRQLIGIRQQLPMISDAKNLTWLPPYNSHVAGYLRTLEDRRVYCLFNFSDRRQVVTWYVFKEHGRISERLFDHWSGRELRIGLDHESVTLAPYQFMILEPTSTNGVAEIAEKPD
jgi:amylosucrase